jgi:hypothetical protein
MATAQKPLQIDPDSRLPLGTIIKNRRGEYGLIDFRRVIKISKEEAEQLMRFGIAGKKKTA